MNRGGTHVIVIGNEKGGSGKSTTAFHLAIYLLYQGFRVASIDVDSRQQTFTQYVRNRRDWAQSHDLKLPHTTHYHLPLTRSLSRSRDMPISSLSTRLASTRTSRALLTPSPIRWSRRSTTASSISTSWPMSIP
jgi:Mrp family chromosome partitioning ATPase